MRSTNLTLAPYFGLTDVSVAWQEKLGVKVSRALARLGEGTHERWIDQCEAYEAAGYTVDVATCKALTDVFGSDAWMRFRR
jgi:hypothetical protein